MKELKFKYWKEGNFWFDYLELCPDYQTQGETAVELHENLREIYRDLISGELPNPVKEGIFKMA